MECHSLARPPSHQAQPGPMAGEAKPRLATRRPNINRRAWAEFWAKAKPGERAYLDRAGAICFLPEKAHLIGEQIAVNRLDARLGVSASFRVPPDPDYAAKLRAMRAKGLPMPAGSPAGCSTFQGALNNRHRRMAAAPVS